MDILEGFTEHDDLIEFVCTKCGYHLLVPEFIVRELEEDNILAQSQILWDDGFLT